MLVVAASEAGGAVSFHLLDVRSLGALCGSRSGAVVSSPMHGVSVETCSLCLELWEMYGKSEAAAFGHGQARAELQRFEGPPPPELGPELACPERLFDWVKCNGERGHTGWHWSWAFGLSWGPTPTCMRDSCPAAPLEPCRPSMDDPNVCASCGTETQQIAALYGFERPPQKAAAPSSITPASPRAGWVFADRVASVLTVWSRASNRLSERASGTFAARASWIQALGALCARGAAAWWGARGTLRALIRRAPLKGRN